jgi:hypothetical protein
MAVGLNIFSDTGRLAFSTEYSAYRLLQKYTPSKQQINNGGTIYQVFRVTVESPSGIPLLFVKSTGGFLYSRVVSYTSSSYTFEIITSDTQSGGATTIDCYAFVQNMQPAMGYGVNAYRANGQLAFSTKDRLLKIAGYFRTPAIQTNNPSQSIPNSLLSAGSVPNSSAVCANTFGFKFLPVVGFGTLLVVVGARISGSQLEYGDVTLVAVNTGGLLQGLQVNGNLYVPIIDCSLYD